MYDALNPSPEMLASSCQVPKCAGDIVCIGDNAGPEFEIVHIEGGTAWVRKPVTFADEALAPLSRLRFVRRPAVGTIDIESMQQLFAEPNPILEELEWVAA